MQRLKPFLKRHTGIVAILIAHFVVIVATFQKYGVTNDERLHVNYGRDIVDWYASFGANDAALTSEGTCLYGGFFDLVGQLAAQISPLDPYETKHFCNAIIGWIGIIAAYRIGLLFGGPLYGCVAAVCLILTPRYYAHSFNNPKDLPFAVFYLWSIYYLARTVRGFPRLSQADVVGLGISIGLTLGIRVGGVLLVCYTGLFYGIAWLINTDRSLDALRQAWPRVLGAFAIAWVVMTLSWPLAQVSPIDTPIAAFTKFSDFPDTHYSFYKGAYLPSPETPRTYVPTWFSITLPDHVLFGLLVGVTLLLFKVTGRSSQRWPLGVLVFAGVFPIAYAVLSNPPLYDGTRHFLFAMPPLAILAGLAFAESWKRLPRNGSYVVAGLGSIATLIVAIDMVQLHPNQVTYFNRLIAGGVDAAQVDYETDYWRHAQKQALRWIKETHEDQHDRRIRVNSRFREIRHQIPEGVVLVDHRDKPDFYIGSLRYDEHLALPGEVVHKVMAGDETELVWIVRPDDAYVHDPVFTNSYWADLHRLKLYLQEAQYLESGGNKVGAAKAYLKLARVCERLIAYVDRLEGQTVESVSAKALGYQKQAIQLLPNLEDAEIVADRYTESGLILAARDIYRGLVALEQENWRYREKLVETLGQAEEYALAKTHTSSWVHATGSLAACVSHVSVLIALNEVEEARSALSDLASSYPEAAEIAELRAEIDRP